MNQNVFVPESLPEAEALGIPDKVPVEQASPIGIIVVNFASHRLIAENLGSLALDQDKARVVVVDNFSSSSERIAVKSLADDRGWTLIELQDNRGFGAAVNVGVREAIHLGCACFLLLNPDATASVAVIEALRERSLREPKELISPRIIASDGSPYFEGSWLNLSSGRIRGRLPDDIQPEHYREWLTGACLVFHQQMWDQVGGLDEAFFLYWEDVDFSYRCAQAGAALTVASSLVAIHDEGGTQQRTGRAKSALYYYYNCRNRLLFATRHMSRGTALRWMLVTPRESWQILMRGGKKQLLYSPDLLIAAAKGSIAGVRLAFRAL